MLDSSTLFFLARIRLWLSLFFHHQVQHGQLTAYWSMLLGIHKRLVLLIPNRTKKPQSMNVVTIGTFCLDLTELLLALQHDSIADSQLFDTDSLLSRHLLHQRGQEVPLIEKPCHPEFPYRKVIV